MLKKSMIVLLLILVAAVLPLAAINISSGATVAQAFTIGTSATAAMPTGWKVDKNTTVRTVGTYSAAASATALVAGNSMSSTAGNGIYNYGAGVASTATDRAVGWISSGSGTLSGNLYVQLTNSGASQISSFTISYGVEKYRNGTNAAGYSIQMYYSTTGTTWTSAGSNFLTSFVADANNNGFTTAPGVTTNVTSKTLAVPVAAGASLYLAWNYSVSSGTTATNAQALGIDNVSILAAGSTITVPTVTTTAISAITTTTATSGGNVTADGGATVTARGVCWATTTNPVATGSHTTDASGTGTFTSAITGLTASTTYYVRAYATNSAGTAYGSNVTFTTTGTAPAAPVATAATSITGTSFSANWGAVSSATSYRLDVSTSSAFGTFVTGYNNLTVTATTKSVTGLTASTTYYYRVRAYSTGGTSANSNTITATTTATDPFNGYYNAVAGLTGTALKTGLHNIIHNNTYSSYTGAKVFLFQTLDLQAGYVRCVYTGRDYNVGYSYSGSTDPNTEHTFAQSWFGTAEVNIKTADLHHLFPTSSSVNSSRGNLPFGVVTTQTSSYPSYNGYVSKRGTNSASQTVFEPADQHKGDLARSLLYFTTRYEMSLSISGVDMLPTMKTWHAADPVSTWEFNRNASIYGFLNNRNPFVDHPEYVSSIWGAKTGKTLVQFSPASAAFDQKSGTVTMKLSIDNPSPSKATVANIYLRDGDSADVDNYASQTVIFPAGSSEAQEVTINVTNNRITPDDRLLVFGIADLNGGDDAEIGYYPTFNLTLTGTDTPQAPDTPQSIFVGDVYPNPFNASVNLPFTLAKAADISVGIYNIKGQLIRTLLSGTKDAGDHNLAWDGKDSNGNEVPSGIYLYSITSGEFQSSTKLIKVK